MIKEHGYILEAYSYTEPLDAPIYWKKHNLTVVRDGCCPNGMRIHFVEEDLNGKIKLLSNALVCSMRDIQ